jgi:hypothetical protein
MGMLLMLLMKQYQQQERKREMLIKSYVGSDVDGHLPLAQ